MSEIEEVAHIDQIAADLAQGMLDSCQGELEVALEQIENLKIALMSARRIGAAVGILMSARKITDDQAFDLLRQASQRCNRKLRDLAEDVVTTGTLEM